MQATTPPHAALNRGPSSSERLPDPTVKRSALLVAVLASFLTPFMVSSVNIALPAIGREFGMNAVLLSSVATAYLLAAAMFLVPFGRLADILGRKRVFFWGVLIYTVSSFLLVFSPNAAVLLACRAVQGFGSAMIFGTGMAIVTSVFPPGERGRVFGINVAAVYLGLSLGPFLGGILTHNLGWRSIFLATVPLGLAELYIITRHLPGEWADSRGERFDLSGSVIYAASLVAVMYGLSTLQNGATGVCLVLVGVALAGLFIFWELRAQSPILDMRLLTANVTFSLSNLAALINYSATFSVTFLLSLYLQYLRGFTPQQAGTLLIAQPIVMALFSPLAGKLSDRIEPRVVASLGMAFTAAGLGFFVRIGGDTALWHLVAGLVVIGFGFALFSSPNTNAVMGSIDKKFYGVGSAFLGTMRLTGQMLSMGIATVVLVLFIGRVPISPAVQAPFLHALRAAFAVSALLCFVGIFASLARGRMRA